MARVPELYPSTDEWFRFLNQRFDVSMARRLLLDRKSAPTIHIIQVSELAPLISRRQKSEDGQVTHLTLGIGVDWERIEKDAEGSVIDLSVPLILAYMEDGSALPIDGYHRIGKAWFQKVETLPFYLLTKAESAKVRIR